MENAPVLLLFIDLPFTATVYTWVFRHTRGCAFVAAVLHASLKLWAIPMPQGGGSPARGGELTPDDTQSGRWRVSGAGGGFFFGTSRP